MYLEHFKRNDPSNDDFDQDMPVLKGDDFNSDSNNLNLADDESVVIQDGTECPKESHT